MNAVYAEPHWLAVARKYLGTTEIPGKETTPQIARWLRELKAWWSDDETPWCGVFVAAIMGAVEPPPKHWYRAKAWAEWGQPVAPQTGAVVVFERKGGGHVGLLVGKDQQGRLLVLGGNQGNRVSVAPFDPARVLAYRWPRNRVPYADERLALYQSTETASIQEA